MRSKAGLCPAQPTGAKRPPRGGGPEGGNFNHGGWKAGLASAVLPNYDHCGVGFSVFLEYTGIYIRRVCALHPAFHHAVRSHVRGMSRSICRCSVPRPRIQILIKQSIRRRIKVRLSGLHLPYIHISILRQAIRRQLILCDFVKLGFGGIVQLAVVVVPAPPGQSALPLPEAPALPRPFPWWRC